MKRAQSCATSMIYISSQTLQKALNDTIPIIIYIYIYKSKIFLNIFDNLQFILHCILRHILTTSTLLPPLSHTHALTPLHQLRGPFVWSKCLISQVWWIMMDQYFDKRAVCSKHCVLVGLGQRPWYQGWATHLLHRLPSSKVAILGLHAILQDLFTPSSPFRTRKPQVLYRPPRRRMRIAQQNLLLLAPSFSS